jgi:hypothetical protein
MTMDAPSFSRLPMSRRTKLLITALFLVLLMVPTVYVWAYWHPANPLRFQIGKAEPEYPDDPLSFLKARVLVTNTSGTPIHLQSAVLDDGNQELGSVEPQMWPRSKDYNEVIPAHGTLELTSSLYWSASQESSIPSLQVYYYWDSSLKYRATRWCYHLRNRSPEFLQRRFPYINSYEDTIPLEGEWRK